MNIFTTIKLALFGNNVDSIVRSFNAHQSKLQKLADRLTVAAAAKRKAAAKLSEKAAQHTGEADRALRVAGRVAALLN
jgi:hypothetical protein